jgi:hypothetical protein
MHNRHSPSFILFNLRRFLIPDLRLEIAPLCRLRPAKEKGLHVRPCSPGIIPANFQEQQPRGHFTTFEAFWGTIRAVVGTLVCASTRQSQKSQRDADVTEWRLCPQRNARSASEVASARLEEWVALCQAKREARHRDVQRLWGEGTVIFSPRFQGV